MFRNALLLLCIMLLVSVSLKAQASKTAVAYRFADFGRMSSAEITKKVKSFDDALNQDSTAQGYVINYGSRSATKARRNLIIKALFSRKYDTARITHIDGPYHPFERTIRTTLWIVPFGAEKPRP